MTIQEIKKLIMHRIFHSGSPEKMLDEGDSSKFRHDAGMETFVIENENDERFIISIEKMK